MHAQRQLGTFALTAGVAIGLIQRPHVGVASRQLPRHQTELFDLAVEGGGLADAGVVLACGQRVVDALALQRAILMARSKAARSMGLGSSSRCASKASLE
jgi:hypothetical protein